MKLTKKVKSQSETKKNEYGDEKSLEEKKKPKKIRSNLKKVKSEI